MKQRLFLALVASVGLAGFTTAANAVPVTWSLTGVTFDDGTSASGSFIYDADINLYSGWSVSVQNGTLSAFTYDTANSQLNAANQNATGVIFVNNSFTRYINFNFVTALTNAGGNIGLDFSPFFTSFDSSSYECGNCGPVRVMTAGSVTSVPEPGTLALLGLGLVGLGFARRRKLN